MSNDLLKSDGSFDDERTFSQQVHTFHLKTNIRDADVVAGRMLAQVVNARMKFIPQLTRENLAVLYDQCRIKKITVNIWAYPTDPAVANPQASMVRMWYAYDPDNNSRVPASEASVYGMEGSRMVMLQHGRIHKLTLHNPSQASLSDIYQTGPGTAEREFATSDEEKRNKWFDAANILAARATNPVTYWESDDGFLVSFVSFANCTVFSQGEYVIECRGLRQGQQYAANFDTNLYPGGYLTSIVPNDEDEGTHKEKVFVTKTVDAGVQNITVAVDRGELLGKKRNKRNRIHHNVQSVSKARKTPILLGRNIGHVPKV